MTDRPGGGEELLPCPFCGREPDANAVNAWCTGPDKKPHALVNMRHEDWNTRALTKTTEPGEGA